MPLVSTRSPLFGGLVVCVSEAVAGGRGGSWASVRSRSSMRRTRRMRWCLGCGRRVGREFRIGCVGLLIASSETYWRRIIRLWRGFGHPQD
jgi:hypothetical protein